MPKAHKKIDNSGNKLLFSGLLSCSRKHADIDNVSVPVGYFNGVFDGRLTDMITYELNRGLSNKYPSTILVGSRD
jgi:hypothetical protein